MGTGALRRSGSPRRPLDSGRQTGGPVPVRPARRARHLDGDRDAGALPFGHGPVKRRWASGRRDRRDRAGWPARRRGGLEVQVDLEGVDSQAPVEVERVAVTRTAPTGPPDRLLGGGRRRRRGGGPRSAPAPAARRPRLTIGAGCAAGRGADPMPSAAPASRTAAAISAPSVPPDPPSDPAVLIEADGCSPSVPSSRASRSAALVSPRLRRCPGGHPRRVPPPAATPRRLP